MRIPAQAIVSNSDVIKNYKTCREKAEKLGRLFIVKNNKLDAVLIPISEYEKLVELTNDLGNDVSSSKTTNNSNIEEHQSEVKYIELKK